MNTDVSKWTINFRRQGSGRKTLGLVHSQGRNSTEKARCKGLLTVEWAHRSRIKAV